MSQDLLDRIDQRTRLAGHNRLALLLFRLGGRQLFGVNVFKVQEVLRRPGLFRVPGLPEQFAGVADVRGRSVPVLDLGLAIGHPERAQNDLPGYLVVTEFNRSVQGFLVSEVERIVNIAVADIQPPPDLGADGGYLTAVTRFQGELIQVIDVESVLADISQARMDADLSPEYALPEGAPPMQVLVVDDSRVARQQIRSVLDQLGVGVTLLSDGRQALDHLLQLANRHLARLHGRYLLRRKTTGELELEIVDAWQADVARDTRTLSGGEGFLVSLALALALSIASGTISTPMSSRQRSAMERPMVPMPQ